MNFWVMSKINFIYTFGFMSLILRHLEFNLLLIF